MFSFFNNKFSNSNANDQNTLEMKAPNGTVYRFSTNTMDQKTFNEYAKKLEQATRNNDQQQFEQIWNEMQNETGMNFNFDDEFKRMHEEMRAFIEDASSIFGNHRSLLSNFEPRLLPAQSIDEQIKYHEQEMKRLEQLKNNQSEYDKKLKLREEIRGLKRQLDQKLKEYGENLDNERMKKKINDELTELNRKIKQLEQQYSSL